MKQILLTFLLLFCGWQTVPAQPGQQDKFNPEEFKRGLKDFITAEASLTPAEAQAFFPIYFEMKAGQRKLQHQMYKLKKEAPADEADEAGYAAVIQKINDLGMEMAQLQASYYKTLCKAVPPRKVYAAMRAEDRFHRKMLEGFGRGKGHPQDGKQK